jgi:hypothetical protein
MLRITKNLNKIVSIQFSTKQEVPDNYKQPEIDSFVIIPGVTQYNHIYSTGNWLVFDSHDSYIGVQFSNETDLDRFFTMLMRDIKLNQLISVETKNSK